MSHFPKHTLEIDAPKILDKIEKEAYNLLKSMGFQKHGRTLHRFVDRDVSQVVHFQLGPAHKGETHLLWVNVGIRIPECVLRSFQPEENPKKYYHEYECNIRARLGEVENLKVATYDLREPTELITADILRQLQDVVMPAFEVLSSRNAILDKRRSYPEFDTMAQHLILLEEAMIYGRRGERQIAEALFNAHYRKTVMDEEKHPTGHVGYLNKLADRLGILIDAPEV